jgi:uncharacterized protein (TIGR02246 family)
MKMLRALALTLCCCGQLATAHAQLVIPERSRMLSPEDKNEIAAVIQGFEDAWAKRDMVAFRALLTEDCDWVNIVGMHWHGRDEVTEMHRVLLEGRYKGVNVHTLSHEITEIAPGVALVVQKSQLDDFTTPDGHVVKGLQNMGMMVLVKRQGTWLIRGSENSSIDPRASLKPPTK